MFSKYTCLLGSLALPSVVLADGAFHTASYFVSYVTQFKGTLVVPPRVPSGGTTYVWPGLQPPDNSGVLQNVLDGRNNHWYFGNTYYGTPSEPYGGGVDASVNQQLGFSMIEDPVGSGNWTINSTSASGQSVSYDFGVQKRLNQALFAVELYDNNWDFGNVVFQNVQVVAETSETSWCTANPQYTNVTIDFEGCRRARAVDL
ncbi:hypothetical protein M409DRAFT_54206 [Zasmidium cellare ATCC 36951]|uniref:Uncharacterized protein n=1 Tax=Zasmidium cellare ATCC 36951 TaxID=1080233 RepID=A0A6A6CKF0_ZASCE|nr:uncharacterized protein M409DRAFT_54206 [Zasmidium cellare ATCC 36951]KAF2167625.1 hypothetical protein M409DRAFT_54206 [Zasmidium cellare ATCC 36951]